MRTRLLPPAGLSLVLLLSPLSSLTFPAPARAQTTDARLDEVEKKLDAALAEIERLKLGAAAPPESAMAPVSRHGFSPAASRVYDLAAGTSMGGYGEMVITRPDAKNSGDAPSGERPTIDLLRAVFYVGHKFTPSLLLNSELEWEHAGVLDEVRVDPFASPPATLSGEATVEFAYLDWRVRPGFGLRAGKLLVPLGLVNEQHEPPVFFGAQRPSTEDVIIPSTWTAAGAGAYGECDRLGLEWRAYLVEGLDARGFDSEEAIRPGRQGSTEALFTHPAVTGRLDWTGLGGLLLGVSGYTGDAWQIDQPLNMHIHARTSVGDVHGRWQWRGLELRGLAVAGSVRDGDAIANAFVAPHEVPAHFSGSYAEAAYGLAPRLSPGAEWILTPYVRFETFDTDRQRSPSASHVFLAGVTVGPHPNVVLKLDREQRTGADGEEVGRWNAALGWLF